MKPPELLAFPVLAGRELLLYGAGCDVNALIRRCAPNLERCGSVRRRVDGTNRNTEGAQSGKLVRISGIVGNEKVDVLGVS